MRDAGYCERALGLYQVMIELHIDLISDIKTNFAKRIEAIEKIWDTEESR